MKEISFQEDLNILIFLIPADEIALFCSYWCCVHNTVVSFMKQFLIPLIKWKNRRFTFLKEMKGSYDSGGEASKLITHGL